MSASKVAGLVLIGGFAAHVLAAQVVQAPTERPRLDRMQMEQARAALDRSAAALEALRPSLEEVKGLQDLEALEGLEALASLDALSGFGAVMQQGPADSLYRAAREQLNAGSYQRAAELFQRVWERYPRQEVAGDAMYWAAFARYQNGDYRRALELLNRQADRYPKARTRRDGEVLATRIRGELARAGNAEAAESVFVAAAPPPPPTAAAPPVTARAPAAPAPPSRSGRRASQIPGCEDQDNELRLAALNALLQMDSERALPILKQVLERRDPCSVELRRKAVFLVSQKGGEGSDVEDILLHAAQSDPDRDVRAQAIFWLSQVNTDRAVTALDSVLMRSTDQEIQEKAIFALSQHGSERAGEILRRFIDREDAPDDLKANAIFWLGQQHGGENIQYLTEIYPRLKSEELKDKVIFSVSQNNDERSRTWLMDLALNANEPMELRKKALFWAGQKGDVAIADLAKLYNTMGDREMKEQLIFAYSQRHEPEAADQLMAIAEKEPDPELRKKAVFWLGQSKDPRAAEFLLRLINR
jgi:HEAT repeat protein